MIEKVCGGFSLVSRRPRHAHDDVHNSGYGESLVLAPDFPSSDSGSDTDYDRYARDAMTRSPSGERSGSV